MFQICYISKLKRMTVNVAQVKRMKKKKYGMGGKNSLECKFDETPRLQGVLFLRYELQ